MTEVNNTAPRRLAGRNPQRIFLISVLVGFALLLVWAAIFELDRVTRASGRVMPSTQNQIVQHLEGGIVREILVAEGSFVNEGDVLLRIEDQFALAALSASRTEIESLVAKRARLESEARGLDSLFIDGTHTSRAEVFLESERTLFNLRRRNLEAQHDIMIEQIEQKQLESNELSRRQTNLKKEAALVHQQLASLSKLVDVGAASKSELIKYQTDLQRLITRLDDIGHQIPRVRAERREAVTRSKELSLRFKAEADEERADTEVRIAALQAQVSALEDQESRSDIRAPISGVVNKLFVNTVGGVIQPGDDLVELVPDDQSIIVEARLNPADRGDVWPGQNAIVKISAYDFAVHGGLAGEVLAISADALQDERGEPFFRVRLAAEASKLGVDDPVVPGMTADVDILTGRHSILSYVLKPINRLRERALRE